VTAQNRLLPSGEFGLHSKKALVFLHIQRDGFHWVLRKIVEFPSGFLLGIDGVDFEGPVKEGGVSGLVVVGPVFWEFVDVFEEAPGKRGGHSCFLRRHQGLDDSVALGGLATSEEMPEPDGLGSGFAFTADEGEEVNAVEGGLVRHRSFGEGEESGIDVG